MLDNRPNHPYNKKAVSGCGEVWYRAWFGTKRPRVRIPTLRPRRSKLCIACSDFFSKVRARSLRCSSFSNRKRCAGLRFDETGGFGVGASFLSTQAMDKPFWACSFFCNSSFQERSLAVSREASFCFQAAFLRAKWTISPTARPAAAGQTQPRP